MTSECHDVVLWFDFMTNLNFEGSKRGEHVVRVFFTNLEF